jgi:hypothetical protein
MSPPNAALIIETVSPGVAEIDIDILAIGDRGWYG